MFLGNLILLFLSSSVCIGSKLRGGSDDVEDRELAVCRNTAHHGSVDRGCTQDLPVCVSTRGRFLMLKHRNGGQCARCVRLPGKWPFQPHQDCSDLLCPSDRPQCDPVEKRKLKDCKRDFACPPDRPRCVKADYTQPKVWFAGMICIHDKASCYNNAYFPDVDYKCTAENPICVKADGSAPALHSPGHQCAKLPWHVYSTNAGFRNNNTVLVNVDTDTAQHLKLNSSRIKRKFLWVPESDLGTVVKINTETGTIVGRYNTWPTSYGASGGYSMGQSVDFDGSLWITNSKDDRNNNGNMVHIGLKEYGQCEDRNNNGIIETSTGLGDLKAWADDSGIRGVATAADECIVHFVTLTAKEACAVIINEDNDVWVSGFELRNFDLVKGGLYSVSSSGTITTTYPSVGHGGYAGLMDRHGVVWSSMDDVGLMRWDTALPLSGPNGAPGGFDVGPPLSGTTWAANTDVETNGLCIDSIGNVWNTIYSTNQVRKFASNGTYLNIYSVGGTRPNSCVVHPDTDDVWVTTTNNGVAHLRNNGTLVGMVPVGNTPSALGVDENGKIWACNLNSHDVSRIDPALNGGVGGVDLTLALTPESYPYTVGDLAGTNLAPPSIGTWTVRHDSGVIGQKWGYVNWTALTPSDSALMAEARSSTDDITYSAWQSISKLVDMAVPDGRYLQVRITFSRATTTAESPILNDVSISPLL